MVDILIVIISMLLIFLGVWSFWKNIFLGIWSFRKNRKSKEILKNMKPLVDYKAIETKYRILPIVYRDGDVEFWVQSNSRGEDKEHFWRNMLSDTGGFYKFSTEEEAREFLKEQVREETERVKKYRETKERYGKPIYVEL